MEFSWPWIFLLLPLPLLLKQRPQGQVPTAIKIPPLLAEALDETDASQRHVLSLDTMAMWCAWLALLISLGQPWRPGDTVVQPVSGRALALAVDLSGSMERKDFTLDGRTSDRLSVVKSVAGQFIDARGGDRISLVLFGREAFIASPLSFDLKAIGTILDSAGIGMALLLSDGTNNSGSAEPESAAAFARELGIRIHTIAMGSEDGDVPRSGYATANSADLDEITLNAIADASGGSFFRARNSTELKEVYQEIDQLERTESDAPPVVLQQDLRHWPLLILLALLCFLAIHRRLD